MALAILAGVASANAQETKQSDAELSVSGSVRLRQEFISGQLRAGFNSDDTLTSLRTRLHARYGTGRLYAEAEMFDSRAFFADSGTPVGTGEVNALELVQASLNARFDLAGQTPVRVQAGRFMMNLGSRRLIASDDYRNTTNCYTGLRIDAGSQSGRHISAIYTMPQQRLPDDRRGIDRASIIADRAGPQEILWGAIGSVPASPERARLEATAVFFREKDTADRATRDRDLQTLGLRYFRDPKPGTFDFDGEVYIQTGEISGSLDPSSGTLDVRASFVHLEAGRQWQGGWRPRLAAEFDYASGDGKGQHYGRFDTLFGMRRAEIAPAGLYNAVGRANLVSPGLRFEAAPGVHSDFFATYKALWLASGTDSFSTTGLRDPEGNSGSFAGHQLDLRARHWLVPDRLRLDLNAVTVLHGEYLRTRLPDQGLTFYAGADLTLNF